MDEKNILVTDNFGFYAILTNPIKGYEYVANICVEHEVQYMQLRIKETTEYKVLQIAEKLRYITENTHTKLIINDYRSSDNSEHLIFKLIANG